MAGLITSLLQKRTTYRDPDPWLWEALGARKTKSGLRINEKTALEISAVWDCVRVVSEDLASLPLIVYKRMDPRGKERLASHPLYKLLHDAPNPWMTSMVFRETLQQHLLLWGNAYAEIVVDGNNRAKQLWPLRPDRVTPKLNAGGELVYEVRNDAGEAVALRAWEVLHIPGLGFDGLVGYSPIRMARESMGLAKAEEEFGSAFFGNGAWFGGFLEHPGKLGPEAHERLKKSVKEQHQGVDRAWELGILEEGMKYHDMGVPPKDAQFLDGRKFQVEEICRWFRVPPHKVGHLERSTFNNIEQENIHYVIGTLRPWAVRWEQEIKRKLMTAPTDAEIFAEHLVDGLLRGDFKTRMEGYVRGRQWGWLSADDVRELENMNPLPDGQGESYLVPLNMIDASQAGETEGGDDDLTPPVISDDVFRDFQPLLEQILARSLRIEADRLCRGSMLDVIKRAEEFYEQHHAHLRVLVLTWGRALSTVRRFDLKHVEAIAERHVNESLLEIHAIMRCGEPGKIKALLQRCAQRWRAKRANETAGEEMAKLRAVLNRQAVTRDSLFNVTIPVSVDVQRSTTKRGVIQRQPDGSLRFQLDESSEEL